MKSSKLKRFGQQVKQFAAQFVQSGQALLGQIIPLTELEQWVREEAGNYRERHYGPLRTLLLFIEQVWARITVARTWWPAARARKWAANWLRAA